MIPLSKNRQLQFEQLEVLRKAAWESITSRRGVEWRVSIAFWSLQAAFIAGLRTITGDLNTMERGMLVMFSVFMVIAYFEWLIQMYRAYIIDKREEGELRKKMGEIAKYVRYEKIKDVIDEENRWKEAMERPFGIVNTMHCAQLATTILLAVLAIFVICKVPFTPHGSPSPCSSSSASRRNPPSHEDGVCRFFLTEAKSR